MKKDNLFVKKLFVRFFLPALFSSLALSIGAVADSFYIGSEVGESGLFIIGSAYPVYLIFSTLSIGMASGGAVHFTAKLGEGRERDARRIFFSTVVFDLIGICLLVVLGLIFREPLIGLLGASESAAGYGDFRSYVTLMLICSPVLFMQAPLHYFVYADGNPKLASAALIIGNFCDCLFGYLFIVKLKMGVNGSVWSTLCGAAATEGICLIHIIRGKGALCLKRCGAPSLRLAARSGFTGFSTAATYLYQFVTILLFNRILLRIGGEWAVASYDVVYNAGSIVGAVTEGGSMAVIALVSTFYGERNAGGVKGSLRISILVCFVLTLLLGSGMAVFAEQFCVLFGISAEYSAEAAYAFRLYLAGMGLACLNGVLGAYFQSIGAERFSYLITGLRTFALLLLFGGLLALGGYRIFWLCFLCAEGATLLLAGPVAVRRKILKDDGASVFSESFIGSRETISDLCERIQLFLEEHGAMAKRSYLISLSVDETLRLITGDRDSLFLQLTLILRGEDCVLHLRDNAKRFNPFELSEEEELGLKIVKNSAKSFHYRQLAGFNTLTVTF